jgi:hypothetical protein
MSLTRKTQMSNTNKAIVDLEWQIANIEAKIADLRNVHAKDHVLEVLAKSRAKTFDYRVKGDGRVIISIFNDNAIPCNLCIGPVCVIGYEDAEYNFIAMPQDLVAFCNNYDIKLKASSHLKDDATYYTRLLLVNAEMQRLIRKSK